MIKRESSDALWPSANENVRDLSRALCRRPSKEWDRQSPRNGSTSPNDERGLGPPPTRFLDSDPGRAACDIRVRDGGTPDRLGEYTIRELAQPGGFRRHHLAPTDPLRFEPLLEQSGFVNPYLQVLESVLGYTCGGVPTVGNCSTPRVVFALFKVFVCSAICFLPKAFANGGWLLAPLLLCFFCGVCSHCVLLLIDVKQALGSGGFGELAVKALGPRVGKCVDVSICLSQFGYCTALALFTTQVFSRICGWPEFASLFGQLLPLCPLCCIRKVKILAVPALVADVLIVAGLVAIVACAAGKAGDPAAGDGLVPVGEGWPLFMGTAIFSFEGIGNIMPIYESMKERDQFKPVFLKTITVIMLLFTSFALVVYGVYGAATPTVAVLVLPDTALGGALQLGYAVAVVLSFPLVLLPASRICEDLVWEPMSDPSFERKMKKNGFRSAIVLGVLSVAWVGRANLDHLVAFIGSFCCVPLGFLYPPLMHLATFPEQPAASKLVKWAEITLAIFCMIFTSYTALSTFNEKA